MASQHCWGCYCGPARHKSSNYNQPIPSSSATNNNEDNAEYRMTRVLTTSHKVPWVPCEMVKDASICQLI